MYVEWLTVTSQAGQLVNKALFSEKHLILNKHLFLILTAHDPTRCDLNVQQRLAMASHSESLLSPLVAAKEILFFK